jgi:hypothetical protein
MNGRCAAPPPAGPSQALQRKLQAAAAGGEVRRRGRSRASCPASDGSASDASPRSGGFGGASAGAASPPRAHAAEVVGAVADASAPADGRGRPLSMYQALEDAERAAALLQARLLEATRAATAARRQADEAESAATAAARRAERREAAAREAGAVRIAELEGGLARLAARGDMVGGVLASWRA